MNNSPTHKLSNDEGNGDLQLRVLLDIIGTTTDKSFLDLCCGEMTITRSLHFKESLHLDVVDEPLRPRHFNFMRCDIMEAKFPRRYDVAYCGDGIEHLSREDGLCLINELPVVADIAILFTPLGPYCLDPAATSPHAHKSAWWPNDFPEDWSTWVFPNWHPTLGIGAFFAYKKAP